MVAINVFSFEKLHSGPSAINFVPDNTQYDANNDSFPSLSGFPSKEE